jgi:ABC-type Zn uptake system ZnuABC Zn-binding protein ZnuA
MIKSNLVRFASVPSLLLTLVLLPGAGCGRPDVTVGQPVIAVTTSYLESAARDLLGNDVKVLRLAEPGTCPGHFDIRPSQAAELRRCRTLLRFEFQSPLDSVLAGEGTNRVQVVEVVADGGLCKPDTYLAGCRQIAEALVARGWLGRTNADVRLQAVAARLEALARGATNRVAQAGLTGVAVIASEHQRDFCEWLGLKVAASFRAADIASVAEIDRAISRGKLAKIKLVIANLPEGRRTADALGKRLGAKVVVFENFPGLSNGGASFDAMVMNNVAAMLATARR